MSGPRHFFFTSRLTRFVFTNADCSGPSLAWRWVTSSSSHVPSVFGTRQRVNERALKATSYGPLEHAYKDKSREFEAA